MLNTYKDMVDVTVNAASKASSTLMGRFGNKHQITSKKQAYKELVTDADIKAEEEIIAAIMSRYPDHSILSEEQGDLRKQSEYRWIIDPLDGTHNYTRNLTMFGVSIALEHNGKVVIGVISLPYFGEIYTAETGKGAYLNGERIHVSDTNLSDSLMIYDTKLRVNKDPMIACLDRLVHKVFIIRMFGCSTWDLCLIAKGQAEFNIDFTAKPWDMAAGALIVEEAGGKVTDLQGNPWNAYIKGYIASNGKIHNEIF